LLKYSIKRLISAIFTLAIILSIVLLLLRQMPIEGYFENIDKASEAEIKATLREVGVSDPFHIHLKKFFSGLLKGDLGDSVKYQKDGKVIDIILSKAPLSLQMGLISMAISLAIGIPLGGAMARSKIWDRFGTVFIVFINAVPSAIYYIYIQMYGTEFLGIDLQFHQEDFRSWILPIFSMSLGNIAYYAMWLRRYMVDEMTRDYVKLARAKGVKKKHITMRHVFRNSFVPMIQYLPSSVLYTVCGSLYIESLYGIPGMGGLLVDVIGRQDNPMVQALVMIYSCIGIIGLLIGDLLMGVIDPRISFAKKEGSR